MFLETGTLFDLILRLRISDLDSFSKWREGVFRVLKGRSSSVVRRDVLSETDWAGELTCLPLSPSHSQVPSFFSLLWHVCDWKFRVIASALFSGSITGPETCWSNCREGGTSPLLLWSVSGERFLESKEYIYYFVNNTLRVYGRSDFKVHRIFVLKLLLYM